MASDPCLDVDTLSLPIAGARPSGESLRYAGTYDAIQEARRADDALAQGDWQRATKISDWRGVIGLATDALATRTKDLQIAAWLVEAAVKVHGFAGLRDGLRVMTRLVDGFWDTVHPEPEDGDLEFRAAPIEWLNERLPEAVKAVPIARSSRGDLYAWWHWQQSREVDNLGRQNPDARDAAIAEGKIPGEEFDKAAAALDRTHCEQLLDDLTEAAGELGQLETVVDARFGRNAPSVVALKKAVEEVGTLVESITRRKRELEPPRPAAAPPRGTAAADAPPGRVAEHRAVALPEPGAAGMLHDRAAALRQLAEVAAFFQRTEPHSPVAYLVQRAVHWGHMSLEGWLQEVIKDGAVLAHVRETLGLKEAEPPARA
jgi:type VI secretion system protein ImpA